MTTEERRRMNDLWDQVEWIISEDRVWSHVVFDGKEGPSVMFFPSDEPGPGRSSPNKGQAILAWIGLHESD